MISKSASARPAVLVFADDDHELFYASPAAWHGAASPWDATTPARDASLNEALKFTTSP